MNRVNYTMEQESRCTIRPSSDGRFPMLPCGVHDVALGNCTKFVVVLFRDEQATYVGIVGKGCYGFDYSFCHPQYVQETLGVLSCDANNLSDFIHAQTGFACEALGNYRPELCQPEIIHAR